MSVTESSASTKVEGGKFLKVKIKTQDSKGGIDVELVGDFFVYPESGIESVEEAIETGLRDDYRDQTLEKAVRHRVEDEGIEMVGLTPEAVTETALEAHGGMD